MNEPGIPGDSSTPLYAIPQHEIEERNLTAELERMRPYVWGDLCSEHDSLNFLKWLRSSGPGNYSQELEDFLSNWFRDEQRHAQSFIKLYSELYGVPCDAIARTLSERTVSFGELAPFLEDEFSICVLIAYDEIATVKSYQQDIAFYDSLNRKIHGKFIREVIKEEGRHFSAILEVLEKCYSDRLSELPSKLDRLLQWDLAKPGYHGTFVMDHSTFYFTPEILAQCVRNVLRYFGL